MSTPIISGPVFSSPIISGPVFGGTVLGDCYSQAMPVAPISASLASNKPASITVELPAGSRLYVDGELVPGTGNTRSFTTPELAAGQRFFYEMKAEIALDGEVVKEDLKVIVHAGDKVEKSFPQLLAAAKRAEKTELAKK